jgi:hypothetical protein
VNKKPNFALAAPGVSNSTDITDIGTAPKTPLAYFLNLYGAGASASQPALHAAVSGQSTPDSSATVPKKTPGRMTPAEAADYLGVKEATLATWRSTQRYALAYIKLGRKIFYTQVALDKFIAARTVTLGE